MSDSRERMNIAIVKLSSLGDVVHALPAAAALRARLPGARVAWVVERREAALLYGNAAV
ncbi:MAG: lipopolysaccharide heptosyltransferase I, partial [Candidatus Rokubacteria bacterium]|nr:lipopolysaccharide heptosyltransferase I [Candidatus Rokubacteria bacterium]